jgi:xylan 1,4-beta-xylosidase
MNYIVHSKEITGPWSDPIFANASGFDPSLFHDDDGKKWFVNMLQDHRSRPRTFAGIRLQEFQFGAGQEKLAGPATTIFHGTELDKCEAPHLYKRNGWYYLLTAEGGTEYGHACTLVRSRNIRGPYELHPQKYILTSKDNPFAELQRAGHGDIVDTLDGKTYLVHLSGRPITQARRCILGRETSIQEAYWKDDWLYVKNGPSPSLFVDVPGTIGLDYWAKQEYTFDSKKGLHPDLQWLRTPEPDRIFDVKDGKLQLIGRESTGSWFEQALVARRQTHFSYDAKTSLIDYCPTDERQFAGLIAYYNRFSFFYLTVTADAHGQREILILSSESSQPNGRLNHPLTPPVHIQDEHRVKLSLTVRGKELQFYYALGEQGEAKKIGHVFDASILSDECVSGGFTGAFVGMAASDLNGTALTADFEYFTYHPVKHESDRYEIFPRVDSKA